MALLAEPLLLPGDSLRQVAELQRELVAAEGHPAAAAAVAGVVGVDDTLPTGRVGVADAEDGDDRQPPGARNGLRLAEQLPQVHAPLEPHVQPRHRELIGEGGPVALIDRIGELALEELGRDPRRDEVAAPQDGRVEVVPRDDPGDGRDGRGLGRSVLFRRGRPGGRPTQLS